MCWFADEKRTPDAGCYCPVSGVLSVHEINLLPRF